MPIVPKIPAVNLPTTNAGNAVSRRNPSKTPGSTHVSLRSQVTQFFSLSLHAANSHFLRFAGSVSRRIADHMKYMLGRCSWISRFTRKSRQLTTLHSRMPTKGKDVLQQRRIPNETPDIRKMVQRHTRDC